MKISDEDLAYLEERVHHGESLDRVTLLSIINHLVEARDTIRLAAEFIPDNSSYLKKRIALVMSPVSHG